MADSATYDGNQAPSLHSTIHMPRFQTGETPTSIW
jgi:hypothetical protein